MDQARLTRRALGLAACLLLPWMGAEAASPLPPPVQVGAPMAEDPLAAPMAAGPGEEEVVRRVFRRFDADGDGRLSRKERARYARDPSWLPLDADADGQVSLREFLDSFLRQRHPRKLLTASYLQGLLRTGRALAAAGWTAMALESYREAARDYPDCAEALLGKARCLEALGRPREARAACERALEVDPSLTEAWLSLALTAGRAGEREEAKHAASVALARLDESMDLDGENGASAAAQLAGLLRRHRRELRAFGLSASKLEVLERRARVRRRPAGRATAPGRRPEPVREVADLAASGDLVGALDAAETACRPGEGSWQLWLLRACLEGALGSAGAAALSLERAGRLGAERWVMAGVGLGNRLDRGERAGAVRELEKLSLEPAQPWQCVEVGWQLAYRGEWGLALPWLERSLDRWSADEELRVLLALCHKKERHDLQAVRLLELLASPPMLAPRWLELVSELMADLGHPARALVAVREAVRQEPALLSARLKLAESMRRAGLETDRAEVLLTGLLLCPVTEPLWPAVAAAYADGIPWLVLDWLATRAHQWAAARDLLQTPRALAEGGPRKPMPASDKQTHPPR